MSRDFIMPLPPGQRDPRWVSEHASTADAIVKATMENNVEALRALHKQHGLKTWTARWGESALPPLHLAASLGHDATVAFVLETTYPINWIAGGQSWNALDCATDAQQLGTCRRLLAAGGRVTAHALQRAVRANNLELLALLLAGVPDERLPAAMRAAAAGGGAAAAASSEDVDSAPGDRKSDAAGAGGLVTKRLLARKERPQPRRDEASPADGLLHAALDGGCSSALVDFLLERGCDPNALFRGQRALHLCARAPALLPLARRLLQGGGSGRCDVDARNAAGLTPLLEAAMQGQVAAMELFLEFKADLKAESKRKQNALHLATERGQTEAVRWLIDKGLHPDGPDGQGATPLWLAAGADHTAMMELLLDSKVAINALHAKECTTPLMNAAANNRCDAVRLLLQRGADASLLGAAGVGVPGVTHRRTAMALAASLFQYDVITLMVLWEVPVDSTVPTAAGFIEKAIARGKQQRILKVAVESMKGLDLLPWRLWNICIDYFA